jgi:tripartite-type tricarboxylate transporter receptor subunit TctC
MSTLSIAISIPYRLGVLRLLTSGIIFTTISGAADGTNEIVNYPTRLVTIVVGFPPGGASDISARLLASKLSLAFGKPFIVENRPGANSNIGTEHVVRSKPDGHTLLLQTIANATNMSTYKNPGYDTTRQLSPIAGFMTSPCVLVVNPSMQSNDLRSLISLLKSQPGKFFFASSGTGGSTHLAGELFKVRAELNIGHVPYSGAAPAMADVIAGHVSMGFMATLGALAQMQTGQLRPIAVASAKRLDELPNVPTMAEAGMNDFDVSSWNGLAAPAGTPAPIINKLNAEVNKILSLAEVQQQLKLMGAQPIGGSSKQFTDHVNAQILKWRQLIAVAKITLD